MKSEIHNPLKPIFIIGCPRSGTTLVMNILAYHQELSWVSNYLNRYPQHPLLSYLNRIYDIPWIADYLYKHANFVQPLNRNISKYLPSPVEPWKFWNFYLSNFQWDRSTSSQARTRTRKDITISETDKIREVVSLIQKYQGKKRFFSKYTDFPRIEYLSQVFPEAVFIHVIRDGRAVAASYHQQIENGNFSTWKEREWWINGWPQDWQSKWSSDFGSPLSFVAFQWKFFISTIRSEAKQLPVDRYTEINYTDVVEDPLGTFKRLLNFCELRQSRNFESFLAQIPLDNRNHLWTKKYSESQKHELNNAIYQSEFRSLFDQ